MAAFLLIYVTGSLCFAVMYPALYDYTCMRYEMILMHKTLVGVLLVIFWPLFLIYTLFCAIKNLKITTKENDNE